MRVFTSQEMQRLDRYSIQRIGIPSLVLMESAARSVVAAVRERVGVFRGKTVAILCGSGNNGGDGFAVARYLHLEGVIVDLAVIEKLPPPQSDAGKQAAIFKRVGGKIHFVKSPRDLQVFWERSGRWDLAIDALFGTGLARPVRGLFGSAIDCLNLLKAPIISVDIPSGLDADSGNILGRAVIADETITFVAKKRGFFFADGPEVVGRVCVADISISPCWGENIGAEALYETDPTDLALWLPPMKRTAHKGSYGHVLVLAGSPEKSGAAVLASTAALRAGVGLVTLAIPESAHVIVKKQLIEVMTLPLLDDRTGMVLPMAIDQLIKALEGKDALVIGPGLKPHSKLKQVLTEVLRHSSVPVVIDADGLNAFGREMGNLGRFLRQAILTPHPGEFARLSGKSISAIEGNRISTVQGLAQAWKTTVLLKGAHTLTAAQDGETYINSTGGSMLATAGTGDVLSGVIGAFLARGCTPVHAGAAAAFVHGLAGERAAAKRGPRGLLASDLLQELPHLSQLGHAS